MPGRGRAGFLKVLIGIAVLCSLMGSLVGRVVAAPAPGDNRVRLCGHPVYPPLSWTDSGRLHGVAPTLIKRLFEDLGYSVSLDQDGNWRRCLKEAEQGHVDIVAALYKNEDRKRYLLYSDEPIVKIPLVFFFNKNNPVKFDSWEDLKGKRVGILLGDVYGATADEKLKQYVTLEPVSSGEQNFEKLMNGRIDVMPLGQLGGLLQARRLGYQDRIGYLEKPLVNDFWYVGISKKSPLIKHMPLINAELRRLKSSGEIDLLMNHFSEEYISGSATP